MAAAFLWLALMAGMPALVWASILRVKQEYTKAVYGGMYRHHHNHQESVS